jgi:hypothetical protein
LSSFSRTIPKSEEESYVEEILSRTDHFIPLRIEPTRARPGDYIYLIYRGKIIGRARIHSIEPVNSEVPIGDEHYPYWANWAIKYQKGWEKPPKAIFVQGHQGIRYMKTHALEHLDSKLW